jgi:hypothetical protein
MTTERKIVGLKADYGSLDLHIEDRTAFIEDAQRVLREIGDALKSEGVITEFNVRHQKPRTFGYAGEIAANFFDPHRRYAVSLVFAHTEDEVKSRPDGVSGYALYRRMRGNGVDPNPKPEDRRPLYGSYPEALIKLVRAMLSDHPLNPDAPKKEQAAAV